MSRLLELMSAVVIREGSAGKARLCMAINRGQRMVERYLNGDSVPPQETAYKLALACGCSEEEALKLARECSSVRSKKSA